MKVIYAPVYGLLWMLSRLPMGVLYALADACFPVVYYVVRYRRALVRKQLSECFPEWDADTLRSRERAFYHVLCDYVVEILKLISVTPEEIKRRVSFSGLTEVQEEMKRRGVQFSFVYLGHYGNWEWLASFALHALPGVSMAQIYHPLSNKVMDRFFLRIRSQFGGQNVAMKETLRHILRQKAQGGQEVIGFIADQSPKWVATHHWTDFLHHRTSFFIGTETIGKKVDAVICYCSVSRPRRGYYHCRIEPITWTPGEVPDYQITDRYAELIEQQIRECPELWLWTHKRWKRTYEQWCKRNNKQA